MFRLVHPTGLQKYARSVSTPGTKNYGKHRSVKWTVNRFGAKPKTKKRVLNWLATRGIRGEVDASGTTVLADVPAKRVSVLLRPGAGISAARKGDAGSVPSGLADVVKSVTFLDSDTEKYSTKGAYPPQPAGSLFPANTSPRPHSGTAQGCPEGIAGARRPGYGPFTPNQYLDAYGFSTLHKQGFKGQGRRIALVEIDSFKRSDIAAYGKCFNLRIPPISVTNVGVKTAPAPGPETTLDLSVISAVAPQLKAIDIYQGDGSEQGIMKMVGAALGKPNTKPDAISISLGACEQTLYGQMQYRRGMENLFSVAAIAGISVVVAAGDNGSAECSYNGNANTLPLLAASDPASSSWVTAVGGTNLVLDESNRPQEEFVWNFGSLGASGGGGGLSILSSRPWYQKAKTFNQYGPSRALPDVSALADSYPGYAYYCTTPGPPCIDPQNGTPNGGFQAVGGTSAATPLIAGGLTLLGQRLIKAGRSPIGFANPLLYRIASGKARGTVFRDVIKGNNDVGAAIPAEAGGTGPLGCCYTSKGYDLASGWGSIKAIGLSKVAAKFAPKRK